MFDVLDTVDILEVLNDDDKRATLWNGLEEVILAVATLNLLIPALPLFTLSKTKYGVEKLSKRLIYLHRIAMVLIVNGPNLLVRLILWHGFSVGISPFILKNLILICLTLYAFYEHTKEKYEEEKLKDRDTGRQLDDISVKYRMSSSHLDNTDPNSCRPPTLELPPVESPRYGHVRGNNSLRRSDYSRHTRVSDSRSESSGDKDNSYHQDFALQSRMVTSI